MIIITEDQKKLNAKHAKTSMEKKCKVTKLQTKCLNRLYILACKAPDLKSLYALRSCRETKILSRQNYSKFIILVDRLMESL